VSAAFESRRAFTFALLPIAPSATAAAPPASAFAVAVRFRAVGVVGNDRLAGFFREIFRREVADGFGRSFVSAFGDSFVMRLLSWRLAAAVASSAPPPPSPPAAAAFARWLGA
jgi:hypothetical protein